MKREESNTDRDAPEVDLIWASQEVLAIYGKTCAFDVIHPPSAARGLRHRKSPFALTILADTMILAGAGSAWEGGILGSPFSIFTSERA